jgi:hypothetical protein
MVLESLRIENFKCIDDSTEFSVRSLTGLVGKNESGKTAILRALYRLNPLVPSDADFSDIEFPRRRWAGYRQKSKTQPARIVTSLWRLDDTDMAALEREIGAAVVTNTQVTVSKGYDNRLNWQVEIDERLLVGQLIRLARLEQDEAKDLWAASTLKELRRGLEAVADPTPAQKTLIAELGQRFPDGSVEGHVIAVLAARLPKFLYFAEYHRLPAEVSIDELQRRRASGRLTIVDSVFLALLDLAGSTLEDLQAIGHFELLVAELEAVSERISKEVLEYWSQDTHLEVDFRCDAARPLDPPPFNTGYVLRTRIRNRRHNVTLSFDERSTGFIWFFSFLVWLSYLRRDDGRTCIVLLDEPGLGLHARAQMDLMRFIRERLLPAYQVIYSTHSPFMIDVDHIGGIRTVEDVSDGDNVLGTKVGDRVLSPDADTLFPLRAALAYDVTRSVFVAPRTLLVDQPSDVLYLKWFSRELQLQGRESLDPAWALVPVGGLDKVAPFAALFGSRGVTIAVLTDGILHDRQRLQGLWEQGLLQFGRVLRPSLYVEHEDAQVEDLLGRRCYRELVHACYGLQQDPLVPEEPAGDAPSRVVGEVEQRFAGQPAWSTRFDRFAPASFLAENAGALRLTLPDLEFAFANFEKLFRDINSLLAD